MTYDVVLGVIVVLHVVTLAWTVIRATDRREGDLHERVPFLRWLVASYLYTGITLFAGKFTPYDPLEFLALFPFAGGLGLFGYAIRGGIVGWMAMIFAIFAACLTLTFLRRWWMTWWVFVATHLIAFSVGLISAEIIFDQAMRIDLRIKSNGTIGIESVHRRKAIVDVIRPNPSVGPQSNASADVAGCPMIWSFARSTFIMPFGYLPACEQFLDKR